MRIVVTGATGNVGTSVLDSLAGDERVTEIVGIARRLPAGPAPAKTTWVRADVTSDDLRPHFLGADVVIHLAWAIQPSRDRERTRRVNVEGSRRVFAATAEAGVPALVHASSVGAYSPAGAEDAPVDESWPTGGISSSFYSVDKSECERLLDETEAAHPELRVVRLRPALIFKREAGSEIRRLFAGPLLPKRIVKPGMLPVLPWIRGLRVQTVHSDDVGDAYRLAALGEARGAFNIAATPILDGPTVARLAGARLLELPYPLVRIAADASWLLRLQPTPAGWVDMGTSVPMLASGKARDELGWEPRHDARETFVELLEGIAEGAGERTPPLTSDDPLLGRIEELVRGTPRP
ncbi:MAG: NAD-dependent epimerase/dehydratase family protein [Solirubrobacterales bacterium]